MKNKYSKEFLKTVLENKEYEVIGEIKSSNDKVLCKTKEGYLVLPIPQGIIRRNDDACIFSKYNPYTIYNIKTYVDYIRTDILDQFVNSAILNDYTIDFNLDKVTEKTVYINIELLFNHTIESIELNFTI